MKTLTLRKYIFMLAFFLLTGVIGPANAQVAPEPGCDPLDPACPIDAGLSLLIAAGIGIGARNAYQLKRTTAKM
jgi:hypothetical protein